MNNEFQRGYEAAYTELYDAVDSLDHPANCAGCRPCVLFQYLLRDITEDLTEILTPDELATLKSFF